MKTRTAVVLSVVLVAGVVAVSQLGAQTPATPTAAPTAPGIATIQSIVEITRAVPAGSEAVDAFTVPAGLTLVVTDIVVTNTGTSAACGGAVNRAGVSTSTTPPTTPPATTPPTATAPSVATPSPTTTADPGAGATTGTNPPGNPSIGTTAGAATIAGTVTQTDSTVTGPLCVAPQSTTMLPLTTGIEFAAGQVVQLLNVPSATAPTAVAPGSLAFHLRGLLVPLT